MSLANNMCTILLTLKLDFFFLSFCREHEEQHEIVNFDEGFDIEYDLNDLGKILCNLKDQCCKY